MPSKHASDATPRPAVYLHAKNGRSVQNTCNTPFVFKMNARSPEYAVILDAHAFDTLIVKVFAAVATRDQSDKP